MIRLDSTLRSLQILLGGAVTTNQLPVLVSFADKTASGYTQGLTPTNTNNTTPVTICAAPAASTVRSVDYISVRNSDTASATVTIRLNDNGTFYTIPSVVLPAGDTLQYTHSGGWVVLNATGAVKTTLSASEYALLSGAAFTGQVSVATKLLRGLTVARSNWAGGTGNPAIQNEGVGVADGSISVLRHGGGAVIFLGGTSGAVVGSNALVGASTAIGQIVFEGADGVKMARGASIVASTEGTPALDSMPTAVVVSTTPTGSTTAVERLRVGADGKISSFNGYVSILSNTSSTALDINQQGAGKAVSITTSSAVAALTITQNGTGDVIRVEDSTNPDSTPFVIDSNGAAVFGHTAVLAGNSGITPQYQYHGTTATLSSISNNCWSATGSTAPQYQFNKSASATIGTHALVANGDILGNIIFAGSDGAAFQRAAQIVVQVAGTTGLNDMPGRIVFQTTPDGSVTPSSKMQIEPSGQVLCAFSIGYGLSGSGGTVSQATSKATGVTLNTPSGQITTFNDALAANTKVQFTLTNSAIAANDTIIIHRKSGGTANSYDVWVDSVAAGSCVVTLWNYTAGSLSESVVLQFSILKGAIT